MPLVQGVAWTLILAGWRHWNKTATYSGQTVGARVRRWWWSVNNWKLPEGTLKDEKLAGDVKEVSHCKGFGLHCGEGCSTCMSACSSNEVELTRPQFYEANVSSAGAD